MSEVDDILEAYADTLSEQTSEEAIREATSFGTVPSGKYSGSVKAKEWRDAYKPFGDNLPKPPRLRAHLQLALTNAETGKKGTVFADASPVQRRDASGRLDRAFQLWAGFAKVHDSAKRGLSNSKLYDEIGNYAYTFDVSELFEVPQADGTTKLARAAGPEQEAEFRSAGYRTINFVNNVKAA